MDDFFWVNFCEIRPKTTKSSEGLLFAACRFCQKKLCDLNFFQKEIFKGLANHKGLFRDFIWERGSICSNSSKKMIDIFVDYSHYPITKHSHVLSKKWKERRRAGSCPSAFAWLHFSKTPLPIKFFQAVLQGKHFVQVQWIGSFHRLHYFKKILHEQ